MASMFKEGVVSVWIATERPSGREDIEVLKDLCGVEYDDIDSNEGYASDDGEPVDVLALLAPLSYSKSFASAAVKRAEELGIVKGRWSVVQYDFKYDRRKTVRPVADNPKFIGSFPFVEDELPPWAR